VAVLWPNKVCSTFTLAPALMATVGDIGEWIAAKVFDIELAATANNTAFDGHFTTGSLAGQTVNV
jgi:hypothetical protein